MVLSIGIEGEGVEQRLLWGRWQRGALLAACSRSSAYRDASSPATSTHSRLMLFPSSLRAAGPSVYLSSRLFSDRHWPSVGRDRWPRVWRPMLRRRRSKDGFLGQRRSRRYDTQSLVSLWFDFHSFRFITLDDSIEKSISFTKVSQPAFGQIS